jgi:hypothetical protein
MAGSDNSSVPVSSRSPAPSSGCNKEAKVAIMIFPRWESPVAVSCYFGTINCYV